MMGFFKHSIEPFTMKRENKMIENGYYIDKKVKLFKKFRKTLQRYNKILSARYGVAFSNKIQVHSLTYFEQLIPNIPFYQAASYQKIILINAQIIAIIRAMEKHGKTVEDTVSIQAELLNEDFRKIPSFAGRVFISKIGGFFLNNLAKKVSKDGWDTVYIKGSTKDDYDVSIITKKCGVIEYLKLENMMHYSKYCNFSDFLMFRSMNIGLKQPQLIEDGKCVFCMKYKGKSAIPSSLDIIYTNFKPTY
jgi:hypothetical protein